MNDSNWKTVPRAVPSPRDNGRGPDLFKEMIVGAGGIFYPAEVYEALGVKPFAGKPPVRAQAAAK